MKKKNNFFIISLLLLLGSSSAYSEVFKAESDTYFSKYLDDDKKVRMPLFEQMSVSYKQYQLNFNYYYDLNRSTYDFSLNQLDFSDQFDRGNGNYSFGRSYQTKYLIFSSITDQLSASYLFLDKRLELGGLFGNLKNFEQENQKDEVYVYSLYLRYKTEEVFPWIVNLKIEEADYTRIKREKSDWLEASFKKELTDFYNPEILVSYRTNIKDHLSYKKFITIAFNPSYRLSLGPSFSQYRMDKKEFWEESISSIIARDEIQEVGIHGSYQWSSNLFLGVSINKSNYQLEEGRQTEGDRNEFSLKWYDDLTQLEFSNYRINSYGGIVQGEKSRVIRNLVNRWEIEASQEYLQYEKVTHAKNSASQLQIGIASWFGQHSRFWLATEIVSNNFYSQDLRLLSRLTIYDWREL